MVAWTVVATLGLAVVEADDVVDNVIVVVIVAVNAIAGVIVAVDVAVVDVDICRRRCACYRRCCCILNCRSCRCACGSG